MTFKDPFQDFIYSYPHPLDPLFRPNAVAVVGAKDDVGSVGRTLVQNLITGGMRSKVYPINPKRKTVLGIECFPSLKALPERVDLVVIVTPAPTVPGIIRECVDTGVKTAIIISAGFKELGAEGLKLEQQVLKEASRGALRIIGPNCLGLMNPEFGLNASFARGIALPGSLGFISQSGAMCTAVLDWSFEERIGFSAFVSIGSMADIDWGDLISYLGKDPQTKSILMYMETIGNPRSFLSAARQVALDKPIIVIKAGRTQEAATAAASHTGSLAGSDAVFDAALERVGVLRVDTIGELFDMAEVLGRQPRPKGPNLAIITNAGGPSVLATDAAIASGSKIAKLSPSTLEQLNSFLPAAWSHSNPVDILGDAGAERYEKALELVATDPQVDGVLVVLSPQDMTDAAGTADCLRRFGHLKDKPLLASWMGGTFVKKGIEILNQAHIPSFGYPDSAAHAFGLMWKYSDRLRKIYETPMIDVVGMQLKATKERILKAHELLKPAVKEGRELLTEYESKALLDLYGIPTVPTKLAHSAEDAAKVADAMGFPVVVKLHSDIITHKSDVGGVRLNLKSAEEVHQAFTEIQGKVVPKYGEKAFLGVSVQKMITEKGIELIMGSSTDPQFGPVILFGAGGVYVEIFQDRVLALPPLNTTLAQNAIEKTKISKALNGFRGIKPVPKGAVEEALVRFSHMVTELREIAECDMNPLLAAPSGVIALDARIVLHKSKDAIPPIAMRPYPIEYVFEKTLKDGRSILIRPIRPEDEPGIVEFHKELSENSIRQRYFDFVSLDQRVAHERLLRICATDFDNEIALCAETTDGIIAGVVRMTRVHGTKESDLKLVIRDDFQRTGIGHALIETCLQVAKAEKLESVKATLLNENSGMLALAKSFGFEIKPAEGPFITIFKALL